MSVSRVSADPLLTLSAPVTAALGSGAPGTTISAAIGPVTVTDDRALAFRELDGDGSCDRFRQWCADHPGHRRLVRTRADHNDGDHHRHPDERDPANSAENVVTGSAGVGDNTATWNPTVTVAVPASAVQALTRGRSPSRLTTATASTTVTFTVTSGALTLSTPVSANLGSGAPGTTISAANRAGNRYR